jgi:hypothetical protein
MTFSWRTPFRFVRAMALALWERIRGKAFFAPSHVAELRLDICSACEHNVDGQCTVCDCFIAAKTIIAREQCPDNPPRWLKI